MKLIKSIVLFIKSLKWHKDVKKYNEQSHKIDFLKMTPEEFVKHLSKGEGLKAKGLELQRELDNLK